MEIKKTSILFIFITVLIDVAGFALIIPVLPSLIIELTAMDISTAAVYGGWIISSYAIMQFLFSPIIGNLSDRFGRRPVLLISMAGLVIDFLIHGFALNIWWLVIGRLLSGICGATLTTAYAFMADISTAEKRTQNFGILGAALGLGFIIGPTLGGVLGDIGTRVPFFVAAGLVFLNLILGFFVLPETLAKKNRRDFSIKRANPLGAFLQLRKYPTMFGYLTAMALVAFANLSIPTSWAYFTIERFSWEISTVGLSMGFAGVLAALVQGGLPGILIPKFGNIKVIIFGLVLLIFGFVGFATVGTSLGFFLMIIPFSLGGLATPALQAVVSNQVSAQAQGELQGAITSLNSALLIVAPPVFTGTFGYLTAEGTPFYFPGIPFIIAAALALSALLLIALKTKGTEAVKKDGIRILY